MKYNYKIFLHILIIALSAFFYQASAQTLNLDTNFTAGVSDAPPQVYISTTQPDGKILVGGLYQLTNGVRRPFLVRLNSDGTTDNSFNFFGSGPNGSVYEIIVLSDGKILIGGAFTAYNGVVKRGIVRLNPDGSLDATFNPGGVGLTGTVQTIALQTDGKILISGSGISAYNGVARFSVLRLNSDGSLDTTFTSPFTTVGQFVEEVDVATDGKILIGGIFTLSSPIRTNFARLNSDGSVDATFNPGGGGTDAGVYALTLQPDGKILIGGIFSTYNEAVCQYVARINPDGTRDVSFSTNFSEYINVSVEYFALQPDGKVLAAGRFPTSGFPPLTWPAIRLNADGSRDGSFQFINVNDTGYSVKLQPDGKIVVTGFFTSVMPGNPGEELGIVRLSSNGASDNTFNASFQNLGLVEAIAQQSDGKILVGGTFRGASITRFNLDGTPDTSFSTSGTGPNSFNSSNVIYDIAVQSDGKILLGGTFGSYYGVPRPYIVRINANGTIDNTFNAAFLDLTQPTSVYDILIQADGKIMISGFLTDASNGQFSGVYRLNPDGSRDTSFLPTGVGSNGTTVRIVQQTDGKYVIGGSFSSYNSTPRGRIARINVDGTIDTSFNPGTGANGTVWDIVLQADGKFLIAGNFTTYSGTVRNRVARINADGTLDTSFNPGTGADATIYKIEPQIGDKFLIGGSFNNYNGVATPRLARINSDGSLDETVVSGFVFDPAFSVRDILTQTDGKVLVGGIFTSYNGIARNSLLRLTTANPRPASFDYDGDGRSDVSVFRPSNGTWYLQQSGAGFAAVSFGAAGDRLAPADYDGDGKTDLAVFRDGAWYLLRSSLGFAGVPFGQTGDVPQPADFDGDGKAELAVFRPSNGTWYTLNLANNQTGTVSFGSSSDKPVVGDYDGDGKADYAVYRPAEGTWYLLRSSAGFTAIPFGIATDKPVPADYDGDGKTDIALYRDGVWYIQKSSQGTTIVPFGLSTDVPAPADYDGDGQADIAIFRDGAWYLQQSTSGLTVVPFGTAGDLPTPAAFLP